MLHSLRASTFFVGRGKIVQLYSDGTLKNALPQMTEGGGPSERHALRICSLLLIPTHVRRFPPSSPVLSTEELRTQKLYPAA